MSGGPPLTSREAARFLGISMAAIRVAVHEGRLTPLRRAGRGHPLAFAPSEIARYMSPATSDLLDTARAAERLGMTPGAVRRAVSDGRLRVAWPAWSGRALQFTPEEIDRYARERRSR